jgi:hypothetical protein
VQRSLRLDGSLVAIAEGVGDRLALRVEPNVIDRPAVHGDRAHPFAGHRGALPQPLFEPRFDRRKIPAKPVLADARSVRKSMHQRDRRFAAHPPQNRDATTLGA